MYFNTDFAMQTSCEYIKYDIEEYYWFKQYLFGNRDNTYTKIYIVL